MSGFHLLEACVCDVQREVSSRYGASDMEALVLLPPPPWSPLDLVRCSARDWPTGYRISFSVSHHFPLRLISRALTHQWLDSMSRFILFYIKMIPCHSL